MVGTVIAETQRRFEAEPGAAQSAPEVSATLENGRARLSAGAFNWEADLPAALGGENLAPSPTAYLLGALAGCAVAFLHDTLAPQLGIELDDVRAVARCRTDARGLLGMDGASPNLRDIELDVVIASEAPQDRLEELWRIWLERCPIYLGLVMPNAVAARFSRAESPART